MEEQKNSKKTTKKKEEKKLVVTFTSANEYDFATALRKMIAVHAAIDAGKGEKKACKYRASMIMIGLRALLELSAIISGHCRQNGCFPCRWADSNQRNRLIPFGSDTERLFFSVANTSSVLRNDGFDIDFRVFPILKTGTRSLHLVVPDAAFLK